MGPSSNLQPPTTAHSSLAGGEQRSLRILLVFFAISLALLNPWVRGDGVGYYAYARAPLIQHNFDFTRDYLNANPTFREPRVDENGKPQPEFLTPTGHLENHFTVGPAMLWSPFLVIAHAGVLTSRALGSSVPADGFSAPYRIAMAAATAFYGFLALALSYRLARKYVEWRWAFLATVGIWWASSLIFYMYFNPSWSHAHSAFTAAVFFYYWHETRERRGLWQWVLLGTVAGLMLNVYYPNAVLLTVLGVEGLLEYRERLRAASLNWAGIAQLFVRHAVFGVVVFFCLLPTFISRRIVFGHPFQSGYVPLNEWLWLRPALLSVLFSSNHGLLTWTPILLLACAGLVLFAVRRPRVGGPLLASAVAYYLLIACYPNWNGLSSYGNRFFISLTPLFVLGLAVLLEKFASLWSRERAALVGSSAVVGLLIVWNLGFLFQWSMHLVPVRGPVSWREMVRNQFVVVPGKIGEEVHAYLLHRGTLMKRIEQKDIEQLKSPPAVRP